jgi:hypothetical protein
MPNRPEAPPVSKAKDVDEALPPVFDEIKEGGFSLDVPHVKAYGDAWHLVVSASWAWA